MFISKSQAAMGEDEDFPQLPEHPQQALSNLNLVYNNVKHLIHVVCTHGVSTPLSLVRESYSQLIALVQNHKCG